MAKRERKLICVFAGVLSLANQGCVPIPETSPDPADQLVSSSSPDTALMKVTAYCPCKKCCGISARGKTSIGRNAWKTAGVAADPKLLPYGTKLYIPGIGIRQVDDTGGAMRRSARRRVYHIDVRMKSHFEAKKFGVKWLNVKILGRKVRQIPVQKTEKILRFFYFLKISIAAEIETFQPN